jgi:serine phosphatase RsbU (regulator of sigma subunit)
MNRTLPPELRLPAYVQAEYELASGDVLVIYTDGITEAGPTEEEEFGEERLIVTAPMYQQQPAAKILDNILSDVQQFSRGRQADDMTLIVASCL